MPGSKGHSPPPHTHKPIWVQTFLPWYHCLTIQIIITDYHGIFKRKLFVDCKYSNEKITSYVIFFLLCLQIMWYRIKIGINGVYEKEFLLCERNHTLHLQTSYYRATRTVFFFNTNFLFIGAAFFQTVCLPS